jgi:hypothetical protein
MRVCYLPYKKSIITKINNVFHTSSTRHNIPFPSLPLFVRKFCHRSVFTKLLKPAGSHCGVDGDADGWPDVDLPCSRDASFPVKETIYRNTFQTFSR